MILLRHILISLAIFVESSDADILAWSWISESSINGDDCCGSPSDRSGSSSLEIVQYNSDGPVFTGSNYCSSRCRCYSVSSSARIIDLTELNARYFGLSNFTVECTSFSSESKNFSVDVEVLGSELSPCSSPTSATECSSKFETVWSNSISSPIFEVPTLNTSQLPGQKYLLKVTRGITPFCSFGGYNQASVSCQVRPLMPICDQIGFRGFVENHLVGEDRNFSTTGVSTYLLGKQSVNTSIGGTHPSEWNGNYTFTILIAINTAPELDDVFEAHIEMYLDRDGAKTYASYKLKSCEDLLEAFKLLLPFRSSYARDHASVELFTNSSASYLKVNLLTLYGELIDFELFGEHQLMVNEASPFFGDRVLPILPPEYEENPIFRWCSEEANQQQQEFLSYEYPGTGIYKCKWLPSSLGGGPSCEMIGYRTPLQGVYDGKNLSVLKEIVFKDAIGNFLRAGPPELVSNTTLLLGNVSFSRDACSVCTAWMRSGTDADSEACAQSGGIQFLAGNIFFSVQPQMQCSPLVSPCLELTLSGLGVQRFAIPKQDEGFSLLLNRSFPSPDVYIKLVLTWMQTAGELSTVMSELATTPWQPQRVSIPSYFPLAEIRNRILQTESQRISTLDGEYGLALYFTEKDELVVFMLLKKDNISAPERKNFTVTPLAIRSLQVLLGGNSTTTTRFNALSEEEEDLKLLYNPTLFNPFNRGLREFGEDTPFLNLSLDLVSSIVFTMSMQNKSISLKIGDNGVISTDQVPSCIEQSSQVSPCFSRSAKCNENELIFPNTTFSICPEEAPADDTLRWMLILSGIVIVVVAIFLFVMYRCIFRRRGSKRQGDGTDDEHAPLHVETRTSVGLQPVASAPTGSTRESALTGSTGKYLRAGDFKEEEVRSSEGLKRSSGHKSAISALTSNTTSSTQTKSVGTSDES